MRLFHFSDKYFDPDQYIPIGNFKKTIAQGRTIVNEFENYLEERRLKVDSSKISRLNCLFTFPQNVADGFITKRKFFFEFSIFPFFIYTTVSARFLQLFNLFGNVVLVGWILYPIT